MWPGTRGARPPGSAAPAPPGGPGGGRPWADVLVVVEDVAVSGVPFGRTAVDPALRVDQPAGVLRLDVVCDPAGGGAVPLAPALVERHPGHHGGEALVLVHHDVQLALELVA